MSKCVIFWGEVWRKSTGPKDFCVKVRLQVGGWVMGEADKRASPVKPDTQILLPHQNILISSLANWIDC